MPGILQAPQRATPKVLNEQGNDLDKNFKAILDRYYLSAMPPTYIGGGQKNVVKISAGGLLRLMGSATVWQDIDFPLIAKTTGANTPAYNTFLGNLTMLQWAVNDVLQLDSREFHHGWMEGSPVEWHCHIVTGGTNNADRYLKFEIEFAWANYLGNGSATYAAPVTMTSAELLIPANTPAYTHIYYDIGFWTPTGGKIGGHVKARFKRVASTGTAPTANPFCEMVQLHIECDSWGSAEETIK